MSRPKASRSPDRSNGADRPVRIIAVYADGRVQHRDTTHGRAPWTKGSGWGRAGAHALPDAGPGAEPTTPAVKAKDPRKVAAGKARAAQAKAAREAAAAKLAAATAKAKKPAAKPATKGTHGGKRAGSGTKPANGTAMVVVANRVTPAQKRKLAKLGAEWLRARIDAATLPAGR